MHNVKSAVSVGVMTALIGLAGLDMTINPIVAQTTPAVDRRASANQLLEQGRRDYDASQYDAAFQSWQQALQVYREIKNRSEEGETLRNLGRVSYVRKDYPQATQQFEQSLAIAREVKNRKGEGRSLGNLGLIYDVQKKGDKAIEAYNQSIQIAREVKDDFAEAISLENLGHLYKSRADFSQTHTNFQNSLTIWRKLKDRTREADLLLSLGNFYSSWRGNCSRAIEHYELSLPVFRELKNRGGEGAALGGIGTCHEESSKHDLAIEYQERSLAVARVVRSRRNEGISLTNLGVSYQSLDEIANNRWKSGLLSNDFSIPAQSIEQATKAVRYSQQGLKIAQEIKDRWGEAQALKNLGRSYGVLGKHQQAIESQLQRLKIVREYQNKATEAEVFATLGNLYRAIGDYPKAIEFHQQSVTFERSKNIPQYYTTRYALIDLAETYEKSGDYAQAIVAYQEAYGPLKKSGGGSLDTAIQSKLGITFAKMGKLSDAEAAFRLALGDDEMFRQAIAISRDTTDSVRIRMAEKQAENYRLLQKVLVRQNRINLALEVAEESRTRALVELLASRINGTPILKDNGLSNAPKMETIRRIAQEQNATLVEYSMVSRDLLYVWVIKPNGGIAFKSVNLKEFPLAIPQLVQNSRRSLGVRSSIEVSVKPNVQREENPEQFQQLHKLLIEPIAAELPTDPNQRVVFIPQGELFLVPFAALQDAQGKYLIEKHTISNAPSIQTLDLTRKRSKATPSQTPPVIVGNPTMPIWLGEQLEPLPGAEKEAIAIAKLFNIQAITGHQATKSTVLKQMQNASIVHLATHGLLDNVRSEIPGAIALAPSNNDNGLLTSNEIFDLKLNANLVVLSACDTGRGTITGDGVVGLSRSFIAAGVPSVVVSLWAVDDESTSSLMSDFYRNLKINPNKAQALRNAMLTTMKQHPSPKDWAAFTLVGEAE